MAATSTPSISSTFNQIKLDFQALNFKPGQSFGWSYVQREITHPPIINLNDLHLLLHEISHAELNHQNYTRDIELISMESQAWSHASRQLAPRYGFKLSTEDDIVQDSLESYRLWLHRRSSCPSCQAVGREVSSGTYSCLNCQQSWQVNEARTCRLQRYKI